MKLITLSKKGSSENLTLPVSGSCESKDLTKRSIYKAKMMAIEALMMVFPELEMSSEYVTSPAS